MAVYLLPPELFPLYKEHLETLIAISVAPDKRKHSVKEEAARHYLDLEFYLANPKSPNLKEIPRRWEDAKSLYTEDSLQKHGMLPWHIEHMQFRLIKAFKEQEVEKIIRISSELGHYIADAHVPLHTTRNYNGQLSEQTGIHGFWESRLPELFSPYYDFIFEPVRYTANITESTWSIIESSHTCVDSVLQIEAGLDAIFPSDQKYSYEDRGQISARVYSTAYSKAYHDLLDGQVERRMRAAIFCIASFWYSAWIEAGQPDIKKQARTKIKNKTEAP